MLENFKKTYFVIDALDKCVKRVELIVSIEKLTSWKELNLHILATSRIEKNIEESIKFISNNEKKICIYSTLINANIRVYI